MKAKVTVTLEADVTQEELDELREEMGPNPAAELHERMDFDGPGKVNVRLEVDGRVDFETWAS